MNILFIYPPVSSKVLAPCNFEPLALEVLASKVPTHNLKIVDMRFESEKNFVEIIHSFNPTMVGISVNNTIQVNQSKNILKHIKSLNPYILNIVGGHHPTLVPGQDDIWGGKYVCVFLVSIFFIFLDIVL